MGRYYIQDNVLTIRKLDEERDAGMYQCRANNSLAAKFSSAQLRVLRNETQILLPFLSLKLVFEISEVLN